MVKLAIKNYPRDFYRIFKLFGKTPRITKRKVAKDLKINEKTAAAWMDIAFTQRIIIPPVLRRKSFLNFREHIYFLKVKDPSELFEELRISEEVTYYSVLTGHANFQIISSSPLDLKGEIILSGERSDYHVSVPPKCTFQQSVEVIRQNLDDLNYSEFLPSPLVYHDTIFEPWDEEDEILFWEFKDELRRKFKPVMQEHLISSSKIMGWYRRREDFASVITMFFPEGEKAYLPTVYSIETGYDQLLIDLFSELPVSTVFYRVADRLIMVLYLPFLVDARKFVRRTFSRLQKEELIGDYTNSNIEYYHRS
ncbi:MAG: hypothetical protein AYK18_18090 [Theionarchaea archaeon DG-70]|nr:MAG: hypothetical protein AYK18_18090 [Theionarchaea archaeon DG-70]MBU7030337.1 hypothetical protein [Theionarchaea archaeon]